MEEHNLSVATSESTNEAENINNNLQNNSEEKEQPENADTGNGSGRRHYRKDNRHIANLKNTKALKLKKMERLTSERDGKKADLDRGYISVQLGDDPDRVKRVSLDSTDKEMIKSVIAEKDYEVYELGLEIADIDLKICALATAKKSSFKNKLSKKKQDKNESDLVKKIGSTLDNASKNGSKEIVSQLQQQAQSGNKNDAYKSLKSFLSQQLKTVAKKLDKDEKLEKNVLDRVLDKLSVSQS